MKECAMKFSIGYQTKMRHDKEWCPAMMLVFITADDPDQACRKFYDLMARVFGHEVTARVVSVALPAGTWPPSLTAACVYAAILKRIELERVVSQMLMDEIKRRNLHWIVNADQRGAEGLSLTSKNPNNESIIYICPRWENVEVFNMQLLTNDASYDARDIARFSDFDWTGDIQVDARDWVRCVLEHTDLINYHFGVGAPSAVSGTLAHP
jgi:hypothetical protein